MFLQLLAIIFSLNVTVITPAAADIDLHPPIGSAMSSHPDEATLRAAAERILLIEQLVQIASLEDDFRTETSTSTSPEGKLAAYEAFVSKNGGDAALQELGMGNVMELATSAFLEGKLKESIKKARPNRKCSLSLNQRFAIFQEFLRAQGGIENLRTKAKKGENYFRTSKQVKFLAIEAGLEKELQKLDVVDNTGIYLVEESLAAYEHFLAAQGGMDGLKAKAVEAQERKLHEIIAQIEAAALSEELAKERAEKMPSQNPSLKKQLDFYKDFFTEHDVANKLAERKRIDTIARSEALAKLAPYKHLFGMQIQQFIEADGFDPEAGNLAELAARVEKVEKHFGKTRVLLEKAFTKEDKTVLKELQEQMAEELRRLSEDESLSKLTPEQRLARVAQTVEKIVAEKLHSSNSTSSPDALSQHLPASSGIIAHNPFLSGIVASTGVIASTALYLWTSYKHQMPTYKEGNPVPFKEYVVQEFKKKRAVYWLTVGAGALFTSGTAWSLYNRATTAPAA